MMAIANNVVLLRDFIEADIEDYIRWQTLETDWKLWDAPWEHEGKSEAQCRKELEEDIEWMRSFANESAALSDSAPRRRLEVCLADSDNPYAATHIGSVSSYRIDDEYNIAKDGGHLAFGIDLNATDVQGRGYGFAALILFAGYLFGLGEPSLYCQTWSGNERMIRLANKLGCRECCRRIGIRRVRGAVYDGLTFVLSRDDFNKVSAAS